MRHDDDPQARASMDPWAVLEALNDGVVVLGETGAVRWCSRQAAKLLGLAAASVLGQDVEELRARCAEVGLTLERQRSAPGVLMLREADDAADAVFLAVAGDQLNGSLNVDRTMTRVIDLAVPRLADACLLSLIDGREIRRMGAVCRGGRIEQWWQTGVPLGEAVAAVARVRATRSAELHAAVTPESLGGLVPEGDQWSPLREPAPHSAMVVPLLGRAAPVGALLFLARERPHFARRNLKVAQSFTRRAALALDNAALYRDRTAVAADPP